MSTYTVHLWDRAKATKFWDANTRKQVAAILKSFFDQVCTLKACKFAKSSVIWNSGAAAVKTGELAIYFLNAKANSLILTNGQSGPPHGNAGLTAHNPTAGTLSEVYVDPFTNASSGERGVAVTAFHEAMHNKLFPLNIHTQGGGGIALASNFPDSPLTAANKQLMAPALAKNVPQDLTH